MIYDPIKPILNVQRLNENAILPKRGTNGSSGFDIFTPKKVVIYTEESVLVATGLRFEIPFGWDLSGYNRSSIAVEFKTVKGAELIDSDYRGEVFIHLINLSKDIIYFDRGDKISQLVMRPVYMGDIVEVDNIATDTERGDGGFGSTGRR